MVEGTVVTRLHVAGLTPNITRDHIRERFSIFGVVCDVEELQQDALGQPRTFTFLTIDTSPSQLKKCLNIMSGSFWRGAQLRLAEAKPRWDVRLEKERNPDQAVQQARIAKKRKRSAQIAAREGFGKEAQDSREPKEDNIDTKKFWKISSSRHLIRPMSMRPTHPIVSPLVPASGSTRHRTAPSRARRRVIDPTLWSSIHLPMAAFVIQPELDESPEGAWEYEDLPADAEDDEDDRAMVGSWKRIVEGKVVEEEVMRIKRARLDDPTEGEGRIVIEGSSTITDDPIERELSPLFGHRRPEREDSPLFASHGVPTDATGRLKPRSMSPPEQRASPSSSTSSPLFPTRPDSPLSKVLLATSIASNRPSAKSLPDSLAAEARAERLAALDVLASMIGGRASPSPPESGQQRKRDEWAGFAESDEEEDSVLRLRGGALSPSHNEEGTSEDEEEEEDQILRLRGGAGPSSSSDDSGSEDGGGSSEDTSSSEEKSSDDSSDGSDDTTSEVGSAAGTKPPPAKSNTLKSMFAPSSSVSGAFSLLASLDPNLELDDLDIPLVPPKLDRVKPDEVMPLEPLTQSSSSKITFNPDPSIPLFFAVPEEKGGEGFWRREDDKEMREIWERDKLELTREWKRRHRDARKQKRRSGGGMGDELE